MKIIIELIKKEQERFNESSDYFLFCIKDVTKAFCKPKEKYKIVSSTLKKSLEKIILERGGFDGIDLNFLLFSFLSQE
jgi:hypothetical protein